jgi:DNA polymerase III subunit alpha
MVTHLHVHSHYSLLEAFGKPSVIVDKAKEYGMEAIALTDYNGMYGIVEFYKYAKKIGVKPLLWVELWLVWDMQQQNKDRAWTIVLLARNQEWYQNLLSLTTQAHIQWFTNKQARIDTELLERHAWWLILIHSGQQSRLFKQLQHTDSDQLQEHLKRLQAAFWNENMYIGITAQPDLAWKIKKPTEHKPLQLLANTCEIPLVYTGNVHYPTTSDKDLYEILWAIRDNDRIYDRPKSTLDQAIHDEATIRKLLQEQWREIPTIETLINNTNIIADTCSVEISLDVAHFPAHQTAPVIQELYQKYHDSLIEGA